MSEVNVANNAIEEIDTDGGRIIFADEVVATIAALAAGDVQGVAALSGGVVEGLTEKLGKKNLTKGVKVEVGTEEAAVDINVNITYGFRIREVCENIQKAVKTAIETMTGLRVVEINVFVQSVVFEPTEPSRAEKKKEKEAQKELEAAEKAKQKELEKAEAEKAEAEKADSARVK